MVGSLRAARMLDHALTSIEAWHRGKRNPRNQHSVCGSTLEFAAKPALTDVGEAEDQDQAEARGG